MERTFHRPAVPVDWSQHPEALLETWDVNLVRFLTLLCALLVTHPPQQGPDPTAIVRRAEALLRGDTQRGVYRMVVTTPRWERSITMRFWSKGTGKFLIRIDEPAQDAGTGFLKVGDEVWSYLPSIEKTIKIPPSMMQQSWMGSDFTNDDLVKESSILDDYTHHLVAEEELEGVPVWHIRLDPREEAPVVWGAIHLWIQKAGDILRKEVYYDQSGTRVSEMTLDEIKELGGRHIPTRYTMIPAEEEGHKTVLYIDEADFNMAIPDRYFTLQFLRRIR